MPRGRPPKLTPEIEEIIIDLIGNEGMTYVDACRVAGISERSFQRWKARGETAISGLYWHFWQQIKRAEGEFRKFHQNRLKAAATETTTTTKKTVRSQGAGAETVTYQEVTTTEHPPDPKWSAWLLERKFPEQYSRRVLEVDAKVTTDTPPPQMQIVIVDPHEKRGEAPEGPAPGDDPAGEETTGSGAPPTGSTETA